MPMSDDRFDSAIDAVAHRMTDGEPSADFKARVLARIESGGGRHGHGRWTWALAPLALAAVAVFAVLTVRAPRRTDAPPRETRSAMRREAETPPTPERTNVASGRAVAPPPSQGFGEPAGAMGAVSELSPAPIEIEPLRVDAMETLEIESLSVDAMESIDVP